MWTLHTFFFLKRGFRNCLLFYQALCWIKQCNLRQDGSHSNSFLIVPECSPSHCEMGCLVLISLLCKFVNAACLRQACAFSIGEPLTRKLQEERSMWDIRVAGLLVLGAAAHPCHGFPGSSVKKNPLANAGDTGLIPGPGRSPREGSCNPLQFSRLGKPIDGGAWWAAVHGIACCLLTKLRLSSRKIRPNSLKWPSSYPPKSTNRPSVYDIVDEARASLTSSSFSFFREERKGFIQV